MQSRTLRLGTRGSPLALAQANETKRRLAAAGWPEAAIEIVPIRTSGDRIQDRPLAVAGGKGLFTKEIEEALLDGRVDIAVHSAKDMPTFLPDGLAILGYLEREDPRDVLVSHRDLGPAALPPGAVIATSSLRRKAMMLRLRPDLAVVDIRGNVETRLKKLADGHADATLLALAGLRRLGLERHARHILSPETFVPAVGQAAIAIEGRLADPKAADALALINHAPTEIAVRCERAFLAALDGSCRTPIGGHATASGGQLRFVGVIVTTDGVRAHETSREGSVDAAEALGRDAGEELKRLGGPHFFQDH